MPTHRASAGQLQPVPKWANWEAATNSTAKGLFMYGQMTGWQLDLHRQPGHRAGHLRDLRRGRGRQHYNNNDLSGKMDPSPPAWAAWAAPSRWLPRWSAARSPSNASKAASTSACARALPGHAGRRPGRCAGAHQMLQEKKAISIGLLGNAADILPELVRRADRGVSSPTVTDQTSAHDPSSTATCPAAGPCRSGRPRRRPAQHGSLKAAAATSCAVHQCGPCSTSWARHPHGRTTAAISARWRSMRACRTPSTSPASCPPTSVRCSRGQRAHSAGWRSQATPRTS